MLQRAGAEVSGSLNKKIWACFFFEFNGFDKTE